MCTVLQGEANTTALLDMTCSSVPCHSSLLHKLVDPADVVDGTSAILNASPVSDRILSRQLLQSLYKTIHRDLRVLAAACSHFPLLTLLGSRREFLQVLNSKLTFN